MADETEPKDRIDDEIEVLDGQLMGSGAHLPAPLKKLSEAILAVFR